jgi:hypothetical protein
MAGRVFDGSPASVNLVIPPYSYPTPARLVIGEDETTGAKAAGAAA